MSDNRFDFLEFEGDGTVSEGEDANPAAQDHPAEADDFEYGPALVPFALRHGGLAVSEVSKPERDPQRSAPGTFLLPTLPDENAVLAQPARRIPTSLRVVEVFGELGRKAGQFNFPCGLALDGDGVLFIADSYNHRVQRITPDHGVSPIGGRGSGRGEFLSPQDVATDLDSAFYVVEQGNHRIQKFSSEGVIELVFGRYGQKPGEFKSPTSVVVAASGDIYVGDTGNNRVQRFDQEGRFLGLIGGRAFNFPGLSSPQALAIDAADNLFVADAFTNTVARFDPSGRFTGHYGDPVTSKKAEKPGTSTFNQPRALAVDTSGLLYVADSLTSATFEKEAVGRCRVLDTSTGQTRVILDQIGRGLGAFARPCGLAVSREIQQNMNAKKPAETFYAADTANHRILRFAWN